jgi:hypothetical protein
MNIKKDMYLLVGSLAGGIVSAYCYHRPPLNAEGFKVLGKGALQGTPALIGCVVIDKIIEKITSQLVAKSKSIETKNTIRFYQQGIDIINILVVPIVAKTFMNKMGIQTKYREFIINIALSAVGSVAGDHLCEKLKETMPTVQDGIHAFIGGAAAAYFFHQPALDKAGLRTLGICGLQVAVMNWASAFFASKVKPHVENLLDENTKYFGNNGKYLQWTVSATSGLIFTFFAKVVTNRVLRLPTSYKEVFFHSATAICLPKVLALN